MPTDINIEELAEMSGEKSIKRYQRLDLPLIRLHGKGGQFIRITKDENGNNVTEDIGTELEGTIVKVRRALVTFMNEGEERYYTIEHDNQHSETALFVFKNGKSTLLDKGKASEIKERHQYLKVHQVLYMILNDGSTVKMNVKGSSLGSKDEKIGLYDYFNEFKKNEHVFEYITHIGVRQVTKKNIGDYYSMTFQRGTKVEDLAQVANTIRMLNDFFNDQAFVDNSKDSLSKTELNEPEIATGEIDPKAIPF